MKITLHDGDFWTFRVVSENGEDRLIQSDWDFPSAAIAFGWIPCTCRRTDGTIDCEHRKTSEMIWEAFEYLESQIGKTVEATE